MLIPGYWRNLSQARRSRSECSRSPRGPVQHWHTWPIAARDIDDYLAGLDETKRSTLQQLRRYIRDALPDIEECISYGMPAFKVDGKTVAGFAAFQNHLSHLPHSGSVLPALASELTGYEAPQDRCTSRSMNRCRPTWSTSCSRPA